MCGLVGKINWQNTPSKQDREEIVKMKSTLKHRGPDSQGQVELGNVILGIRRLAIIDVKGGNQPLFNENGQIAVIGNGEIYNYLELRRKLKHKGHQFKTRSDMEIVVHLYEEYGPAAITQLRGMFALVICDQNAKKVLLVRDRLGEKPLYYAFTDQGLVFASEMKAIINAAGIKKELDYDAIDDFFRLYYIPEPDTPIKQIKKLPTASIMTINWDTQKTTIEKYWRPEEILPQASPDLLKNIKEKLIDACEITLRSNVEVGISLSGGVDSGTILSLTAPKYKKQMKAFCVGYSGRPASDERHRARIVAEKFGIDLFESELGDQEVVERLPFLIWDLDDPIANISAEAIFAVNQLARKHQTSVLLGGLGGDELFWGYPSVVEMAKHQGLALHDPDPEITGKIVNKYYSKEFKKRLKRHNRHPLYNESTTKAARAKLVVDKLRDIWLPGEALVLNDRLGMAASVETRSPFLDYQLVETVISSKEAIGAYNLPPKYYLKKAMEGIVPEEILNYPKKGFTPPVSRWLQKIIALYEGMLNEGFLWEAQIIDKKVIKELKTSWRIEPESWHTIYCLIILEIWGREYIWKTDPEEI